MLELQCVYILIGRNGFLIVEQEIFLPFHDIICIYATIIVTGIVNGEGVGASPLPLIFFKDIHSQYMHFKIPRHSIPSDVDDIARKTCGHF